MRKDKPTNVVVSVHDRLLKMAKERQEEFHFLLTRYALERLLYRLSRSPHRDVFVLKGALLFALWSEQRPGCRPGSPARLPAAAVRHYG